MSAIPLTVNFVNDNFYTIDGILYRKNGKKIKSQFNTHESKYIKIYLNGKKYFIHRILWILYNQKEIPEGFVVDHIDGNKHNNSKENLRICTVSENCCNSRRLKPNLSGVKGITVMKTPSNNYYYAHIIKNGISKAKNFQYTEQGLEDAKIWLETMRKEWHKEFARSK